MNIVDKIGEKAINLVTEHILKTIEDSKKGGLWIRAIRKACEATEGIDDSFADYIVESLAVQRHFIWLTSNKSLDDIYRSFILTIAVELCLFNTEKKYAISLGIAILDNWFEMNGVDYKDKRNQLVIDKIIKIVNDRERLYREYFLLYNDPLAKDTIRVYYPKNDENWISWNEDYSVDIKVNLSKGTEYGFCRMGFSYARILEQNREKNLKVAYIDGDKEIYRFENEGVLGVEDKRIIWAW